MQERIAELHGLGCESVISFVPAMWKRPDILLPHWAVALPAEVLKRADEIRRCARLFSEERSQREFLAQIRWRLHGDFSVLPPAAESTQYFAHDCFQLVGSEVFVDCGAFDGDTLKAFLEESRGRFERVLCVEPDPKNFRRLTKVVRSLPLKIRRRIVCLRHAVSTEGHVDAFLAAGDTSSRLGLGDDTIRCVSLDTLLRDTPPSFLKFDIEGAEPDALKGARGIIERNSPVIAVCAYHTPEHVWELPLLIDAIRPGYCYFLRPYRQVWELVCYAAPLERASSPFTKVNVRRDAIMAITDSTG
jgi:FkbM family methyltransferase